MGFRVQCFAEGSLQCSMKFADHWMQVLRSVGALQIVRAPMRSARRHLAPSVYDFSRPVAWDVPAGWLRFLE
jgi:hypothetical protein